MSDTPADAPAPTAVTPGATDAGAQPQDSAESVLAVIGNITQVAGFMGLKSKTYSLVLTSRRVIFAQLTKEKITATTSRARDAAKLDGKGLVGQWGAQLGASFNYHDAYRHMSPDAALAETPGNFAIDRSAIQKVKYRVGTMDDDGHSTSDQITIKTTSGKHKLQVNGSLGAAKEAFRAAGIG